MATPLKIKLQPLSAEAMQPYGHMLENRQPVFPEVEPGEGRVAIEMQHLKPRQTMHLSQMAVHFSYNQTFINVTRKNPGEGTTRETGGDVALTHARRPYVDFVDIEKRDNRVIELDYGIVTQAA